MKMIVDKKDEIFYQAKLQKSTWAEYGSFQFKEWKLCILFFPFFRWC